MGRPKEPIIEVGRVVEEALAVIDEHGLEGLSMRGLGKRLGVNPASLYYHFHNKEDILDAVREHIVRKAKISPRLKSKGWEEQLIALGNSFRAAIIQHPNATQLIVANNPLRTRVIAHSLYENVIKTIVRSGFTEEQAAYILVGIEILTSGSVNEEANFGRLIQYGPVDSTRYPYLYRASRKPVDVVASFNSMLEDFIDGAKRRFLPALEI
jgi:TetR/AcrR family transcriptional regulator, tetracycline repressor protein